MDIENLLNTLPEVVPDETNSPGSTWVTVGGWTFCVEDDLEYTDWWDAAKAWVAYATYLDKVREERSQ